MYESYKHMKGRAGRWSLASLAGLALIGISASPLIAAASQSTEIPPLPGSTPTISKPVPQPQTPDEFQKALGIPLEDAGGGSHAALEQKAQAAKASLVADGYTVSQIKLNYESSSADIFVSGEPPTPSTQATARTKANGATINFVSTTGTVAMAETLQARIDADRDALAKQGIKVGITGIVEDGTTVLVGLIEGTPAQVDYMLKTYGTRGLMVDIAGPQPQEAARTNGYSA